LQHKSIGQWTRDYYYEFKKNNFLIGHDEDKTDYLYDAHGNMTRMPHLEKIDWNFLDRISQVNLGGGGTVYYTYDSQGNRVRKVIERLDGKILDRIYIGTGFEVYREKYSGGVDLERKTLHITDNSQRVAIIDTETGELPVIRYQIDNHLGSACLELDENAAIISYEEYHPFGTTSYRSGRNETEVSQKRYRYIGKERDEETGLYYYGMRYYAAWIGRFVSVDPLQFDYPHYTPFQYAGNKPISFIDLDGAEPDNVVEENNQSGAWPVYFSEEEVMSKKGWQRFVVDEIKRIRNKELKFDCTDFHLYLIARYYQESGVALQYTDPVSKRTYNSNMEIFNSFNDFVGGMKGYNGTLKYGLFSIGAGHTNDLLNDENFLFYEITDKSNIQVGDGITDGIHNRVQVPNAGLYVIHKVGEEYDDNITFNEFYDMTLVFSGSGHNDVGEGAVGKNGRWIKMGTRQGLTGKK
jgi:RHS repeat-associated protein